MNHPKVSSWWQTSLVVGALAATITLLAMLWPSKWWLVPLCAGVVVFVAVLIRDPQYWSRKTFSVLLMGWLTMRATPRLSGGLISPGLFGLFDTGEVPWTVDIAFLVIGALLLAHDVVCNRMEWAWKGPSSNRRASIDDVAEPIAVIDRSGVVANLQNVRAGTITVNLVGTRWESGPLVQGSRDLTETLSPTSPTSDFSHLTGAAPAGRCDDPIDVTIEVNCSDCLAAFASMTKPLRARSIKSADWVAIAEEESLSELVADPATRFVCVLGPPGSGKTTMMARLCERVAQQGGIVLGLKVDLFRSATPFAETTKALLGLNIPLTRAISAVAGQHKIVVVIDQLDALAELVDLHSDRLNDVLHFIDDCTRLPNVLVVCSCREFEFRHDVRFSTLDPAVVRLNPLSRDDVLKRLDDAGITGAREWPESFREIIQTPQHLHVFLERFKSTGKVDVFQSYHEMLDDLWERHIHTQERRSLIYDLAESLTDDEAIWAPVARFEERQETLEKLVGAEILCREGAQIGFRHQTLLEHARARLFAKSDQSLCEHVLERQDAIHVRPTLWAVLTYLRAAHPAKYRKELDAMFAAPLRMHVRFLLLEFLGQQANPKEFEIVHLTAALERVDDRTRALIAIQGNGAWFTALKDMHLPVVMQWPAEQAWPMVGVIRSAFTFARSDCLSLLDRYWLADDSKDHLTFSALKDLKDWDDKAVNMACRLAQRAEEERNWRIEVLATEIAEDNPSLAARVVAEDMRRSLRTKTAVLEKNGRWHGVEKIAEADPIGFLSNVWQPFVEAIMLGHDHDTSMLYRYRGGSTLLDDQDSLCPLMEAVRTAVKMSAACDPMRLVEITRPCWTSDNINVHGIIAIGLAAAPAALAPVAVEYLCGDPRRMLLGNLDRGDQHFSLSLIAAIAPHLTESDSRRLEQVILTWSMYRPDIDLQEEQRAWDREARLRLLRAIPKEKLSEDVAKFAKAEEAELPNWNADQSLRVRCGFVREIPPMTKEQMSAATDEDVVGVFRGPFEISTRHFEWSVEDSGLTRAGGGHAAARELAELAKTDLNRVISILYRMIAEDNEQPVAAVLHRLNESPISPTQAYALVLGLAAGREPSEEFRAYASYLLYKRTEEKKGLPQDICELIESWLAMAWSSGRRENLAAVAPGSSFLDTQPQSILLHADRDVIDTDRSFWPLMAVTHGYLMRDPADTASWLDVVEDHLSREIDESTWRSYAIELRWISLCGVDARRGEGVIRTLFRKCPALATSRTGATLVASVAHTVSREFLESYLTDLWATQTPWAAQAYGELVSLLAVRKESAAWARGRLDAQLVDLVATEGSLSESLCVGVVFAASQIWEEVSSRSSAVDFLEVIVQRATKRIAVAFGTVFWASEDFIDDTNTRRLLKAIAQSPNVLTPSMVQDLVVHLAKLCRCEPELVLQITQQIITRFGHDVGNISTELYGSGVNLVNIAMTLQRFAATRSAGLTLLEDLMRLGVGEAFSLLRDIDIRPSGCSSQTLERPRRRRRRNRRRE